MAKIVLDQKAPINQVRLAGFYWTNIAREGEGYGDIAQIYVRFVYGREVNGVFQQFGSKQFAISPGDYGAGLQNLLNSIEQGALNRFVAEFGGTVQA